MELKSISEYFNAHIQFTSNQKDVKENNQNANNILSQYNQLTIFLSTTKIVFRTMTPYSSSLKMKESITLDK